jgi:Na+/H+ antiporter NhaD/arsenite permease-like protein
MEMSHLVIGVLIFTMTYIAIVSEKFNRMVIAMVGASLMIVFHVLTQDEAYSHIDFNTIGLLIGMMIIVNVIRMTGLFEYLAIVSSKISKGRPIRILLYFSILTALASAFLDNVTTILMIVPVTLVIAETLKLNPIPFVISEIIAANIGGTATLIGSPPNIMIGGEVDLTFMDFLVNLMPLMIVIFIVVFLLLKLIYKKDLVASEENIQKLLSLDHKRSIRDKVLVKKSITVLIFTLLGFVFSEQIGIPTATIALFAASVLLMISDVEPDEMMERVEWTTVFFFIGLFILVGSLEEIGVIAFFAEKLVNLTNGSVTVLTFVVLWMSAILSSFLDNIPYVATMIPMISHISEGDLITYEPVWWALAIGGSLGGTGTIIGSTANVVARGIAEKHGYKLSFVEFFVVAFPLMILSIFISSAYLYIFYF